MSRVNRDTGNYYLNDLALQGRMKNVMDHLVTQFPFTHQGTFGGFMGGEDRGTERPNGCRDIGPRLGIDYGTCGYGGNVMGGRKRRGGKKMKKMPLLGEDSSTWSPEGMGLSGGMMSGGATGRGKGNAWIRHVRAYRAKHPGMSYATAMKKAKSTYKRSK